MRIKIQWLIIALVGLSICVSAQNKETFDVAQLPGHPRILLLKSEEKLIQNSINNNPSLKKIHEAILKESDAIIALQPLERIQIGRRLLDKSRECLRRVFQLSYAYRMTGDERYFKRAETEMLTISNFSDWNPTHFLDVAEMTMGMSIGYDWLHDKLSDESKRIIKKAIFKKGVEPSFNKKYNGFLTAATNWNQVCNAGISYGALALYEDHPDTARLVIERAASTLHLAMDEYKPDGAYPEGYSYWNYGTSFNVMFLSAVDKVFHSDFGLTQIPGFLKTGGFFQSMTGATGLSYNWGDSGLGGNLNPTLFWFAQKKNDPSLLWVEKKHLQREDYTKYVADRLLPAIMIWAKDVALDKVVEPSDKVWIGQGANPVALMRTSWTDPDAIYLGFKVGSASVNHGHMDIGSFIMEAKGVRWASDLGSQEYESLESKGMQIFGRTQDAQRWTILRLNNFVHNTLTVDNQLQLVKGYAKVDRYSAKSKFSFAISDLSTVYANQLASIKRGVGIVDEKYVIIRDELTASDKATMVRWNMLTLAEVTITGKNTATLTKDGKKLFLRVETSAPVILKTWSSQPTTDYDAPNPGTIRVGFEVQVEANKKTDFTVLLIPEGEIKTGKVKSLNDWK